MILEEFQSFRNSESQSLSKKFINKFQSFRNSESQSLSKKFINKGSVAYVIQ